MGRGVRACVRACMSEPVRGDRGRASDRRRQEAPSAGPPQPPPPPPRDHTPSRADTTHPHAPSAPCVLTRAHHLLAWAPKPAEDSPPPGLGPRAQPRRAKDGAARASVRRGCRLSPAGPTSEPKHPSAVRLPRPGLRPRASGYPTLLSPPGRGGGFNVSYPALTHGA